MILHGDCLDLMAEMEPNSVDAVITDPPYFRVKNEPWDRKWDSAAGFLDWMRDLCTEWQRILKPNGSLYVFASPRMAARVECVIAERFNVLNTITWSKPPFSTKAEMFDKETMRGFFPASERIIFAEHYGADNIAKGEAGYAAKCDELRGFLFEPLRSYLSAERDRAGWTTRRVAEAFQQKTGSRTVTGMAGHWFEQVQWSLPTAANYEWLRELFNTSGGDYLKREYDDLKREYDDLKREYDDLRRPFNASPNAPYTDVWTFATVPHYPGKHPCEKPVALMTHMIEMSTNPGAVVLDCFAGSGATGVACIETKRQFIGIEQDTKYVTSARNRIAYLAPQLALTLELTGD